MFFLTVYAVFPFFAGPRATRLLWSGFCAHLQYVACLIRVYWCFLTLVSASGLDVLVSFGARLFVFPQIESMPKKGLDSATRVRYIPKFPCKIARCHSDKTECGWCAEGLYRHKELKVVDYAQEKNQ